MLWIKNYNSCVLSFFPVMVSEIPFEIHACIIYMDLKRNFTDKCSVKFLLRSMNIMDLKRNFTDHLSMYYMLLWDVLSACGWHSWYCTYFKCRRGWSVKWGTVWELEREHAGQERKRVYIIPMQSHLVVATTDWIETTFFSDAPLATRTDNFWVVCGYCPLPLGLPSLPTFALALVTYIASLPPTYSICMYMCGRDAGQWRSRVR